MNRKLVSLVIIGLCVISVLVSAGILYLGLVVNNTKTNALIVNELNVNSKGIHIKGTTSSSSLGYKGFTYYENGGALYIMPRYAIGGIGEFEISINTEMSNTKEVYLQGNEDKDLKSIWKRNE